MSGGKKKRKDINQGLEQSKQFTQQGAAALQPFAQAGVPAVNQLSAFQGLLGPEAQKKAFGAFKASPYYQFGQDEFQLASDDINAGLSSQGLLFSQANLNATELARKQTQQNAFLNFLNGTSNLSGIGLSGAQGQAGLYGQQGVNALNAGQARANTRQGFLGTLGQISQIGGNFGSAYSGFSDRRLKDDIRKIDSFGPLSVYHWRWNEDAEAIGLKGEDVGFMADEVEKVLPESVAMRDGYKTVNYAAVMERFEQ